MPFDSALQRQIMGRFATGVAIVTTNHDGVLQGMTANSLTSLSLDPPMVLIAVSKRNFMCTSLVESGCFAINLLTSAQQPLSDQFARPGPKDFSKLSMTTDETGAPIFTDAMAYIDCRLVETVPGGDHDIFIGECVAGGVTGGEPLVFFSGNYTGLQASAFKEHSQSEPIMLEDTYEYYGSF